MTIYQEQKDRTLVQFSDDKRVTDGSTTVAISLRTARIWADNDVAELNKWGLYEPAEVINKPTVDPKTEELEKPTEVLTKTTRTTTYTKKAKTARQIADEKTAQVSFIDPLVRSALYDIDTRVRASTGAQALADEAAYAKELEKLIK